MDFIIYIAIFVVLIVGICMLIVISPMKESMFDLGKHQPVLYYNFHMNNHMYTDIVAEALTAIGYGRPDMQLVPNPAPLEWIDYPQFEHIRGSVGILPLYYSGRSWDNTQHFPKLMNMLQIVPGVINVFMWRFENASAILQHVPSPQNTHEQNIFFMKLGTGERILRYILALNSLSYSEHDCSLWVNGKIKKLSLDDYLLWDPLQPFSLHNDTNDENPIIFLVLDIVVPRAKN